MAKEMVRVVKGRRWDGGPYGSRDEHSEPFEYDLKGDPEGLRKLGLVERVKAEKPVKAEK